MSNSLQELAVSIKKEPEDSDLYFDIGYLLLQLGKPRQAARAFCTSLRFDPENNNSKAYLSIPLLLHGSYKEGLQLYEYRHTIKTLLYALPTLPLRENDKLILSDEILLVVCEQGFGDCIQFIRYVIYLQRIGVQVTVCVHDQLVGLIKKGTELKNVISPSEVPKINSGKWLPMLSLPLALGVTPSNPIISEQYIFPEPTLMGKWSELLGEDSRPIVGIAWKGNPVQEKTTNKGRSAALSHFENLLADSRFRFLSLQKGDGAEELASFYSTENFVQCQEDISNEFDFEETSAIISCCSLVITVDTCVAHLAGSMGTPVYILLKKIPEWRWGLNGEECFWYPSAKLWRQTKDGDWQELMQRVHQSLDNIC